MWYSSGTVSVTANGATVTGSGTAFLANVRIGDGITIQGSTAMHEVIGIASNTSLTIRPAYAGTSGSGRQYATVPVLGYDKDLSDAFNQIRLQFGDTLSALQPWAYAATADAALSELGLSATGKAVARGSAEQGRAALQLGTASQKDLPAGVDELGTIIGLDVPVGVDEVYHHLNVVGTVSESGGVPTGALVQYGSNANGEFWRYAGGMQVCQERVAAVAATAGIDRIVPWTFPAEFSNSADVVGFASLTDASASLNFQIQKIWVANPSATMMNTTFRVSVTQNHSLLVKASGRWHA